MQTLYTAHAVTKSLTKQRALKNCCNIPIPINFNTPYHECEGQQIFIITVSAIFHILEYIVSSLREALRA